MIFSFEIDAHPKSEADGKPRPNQGVLLPVGGAENPVIPVSEKGL
jgi:hypothetical protein